MWNFMRYFNLRENKTQFWIFYFVIIYRMIFFGELKNNKRLELSWKYLSWELSWEKYLEKGNLPIFVIKMP